MYFHPEGAHSSIRFSVGSPAPSWFRITSPYETFPIPSACSHDRKYRHLVILESSSWPTYFVPGLWVCWGQEEFLTNSGLLYITAYYNTYCFREKFKAPGPSDLSASVSTEVSSLALTHTFCNWTRWSFLHLSSLWRSRRCASPSVSWPA